MHNYSYKRYSILSDGDISSGLQQYLLQVSKDRFIPAADVVAFMKTLEMEAKLTSIGCSSISECTARRWLQTMDWHYKKKPNGMYIDGHKREDVVVYREKFVEHWMWCELQMMTYNNNENEAKKLTGFSVKDGPFCIIFITHNESTFYANDHRKMYWWHSSQKATLVRKGEGESIMVSNFLTAEWERLKHGDEKARIPFWAGKNRDGYFDADDLLHQVEKAIDIFKEKTNRFINGLWLFDNAPSHQKHAPNALLARYMRKSPLATWVPKGGACMRYGKYVAGQTEVSQDFYYHDDHPTMPRWFKGMEQII
ncbi:hypothetical protein PHLGIDRAFT_79674 [Phlebiopsis gigantea 11061_1 CR5-6]|uniref:Uncharacterized protein n=1 Tax=Phlebiopsis gigantea (strain 11061_1 CR5-6) TaxID=745531 RepID=A0A0C3RQH1_PHLG1|nr:hypothetical protein PHLGIDRAFT_79674 [Phlebiopsis gigantea 11061_1 CR5-6]